MALATAHRGFAGIRMVEEVCALSPCAPMTAETHVAESRQETTTRLAGKTLFMSGGSRGIGLAIALRAARDGANVVIAAKTADADPRLEGTIHTAAAADEVAGGKALPLVADIRVQSPSPLASNCVCPLSTGATVTPALTAPLIEPAGRASV
jgi:hypothetical protein